MRRKDVRKKDVRYREHRVIFIPIFAMILRREFEARLSQDELMRVFRFGVAFMF